MSETSALEFQQAPSSISESMGAKTIERDLGRYRLVTN